MAQVHEMPGTRASGEYREHVPKEYWVIFNSEAEKEKAYDAVKIEQQNRGSIFSPSAYGGASDDYDPVNRCGLYLYFPGATEDMTGSLENFFRIKQLEIKKVSTRELWEEPKAA